MRYILDHTVFMDHDMWHLFAVAALIILAYIFLKKISEMKEIEEDMEEKLSQLETEEVASEADLSFMDDLFEKTTSETPKT